MIIYGINPVLEALKAGRATRVRVADRRDDRIRDVLREAQARSVPVEQVPRDVLAHAAGGGVHQGVVAEIHRPRDWSVDQLVKESPGPALLVVLDGVEDAHNVGAIVRTCDAAGVGGIVRQTRRAASLDGVAAKASAGALAYARVADVVNIARAIEELKGLGVWTVGLTSDGPQTYDRVDYTHPTAFVLGAEGAGLRRLVRESCDWLVGIPMAGHVQSLNVSAAAAVVLYEAVRQRRAAVSAP